MTISSRTPEGDRNRCPICRHRCRLEPSCVGNDAPCPRCGHLLRFPKEACPTRDPYQVRERPPRPQGKTAKREPSIQATRLIARLIRRGSKRLGAPERAIQERLATIRKPYPAERLLSLLHEAATWKQLLAAWDAEAETAIQRAARNLQSV